MPTPEIASMVSPPSSFPLTVPDIIWYCSTSLNILFVGVLVWFGKRGLGTLDEIKINLNNQTLENAITKTKLDDHMNDKGQHCKGLDCPRLKDDLRKTG